MQKIRRLGSNLSDAECAYIGVPQLRGFLEQVLQHCYTQRLPLILRMLDTEQRKVVRVCTLQNLDHPRPVHDLCSDVGLLRCHKHGTADVVSVIRAANSDDVNCGLFKCTCVCD